MPFSSPEYLTLCQELGRLGLFRDFERGTFVARAFADLGYEEFCLLNERELLSLFTGNVTSLREQDRGNLFAVPGASELVAALQKTDFDLLTLEFREQRSWLAVLEHTVSKARMSVGEASIEMLLAKALLRALQGEKDSQCTDNRNASF